jgi:hypothetical protein
MMKPSTGRSKKSAKRKAAPKAASGKDTAKIFANRVARGNATLEPVAEGLRRLVKRAVPESRETVNPWGIPTFDFHGPMCLFMAGRNHVTFGFVRGTSLSDPGELLEGTGENLRHVKLKDAKQLRDPQTFGS